MGVARRGADIGERCNFERFRKKRKLFFIPFGVPRGIRNCLYWSCFGKYELERELREFFLLPVTKVGGASLEQRGNSQNGSVGTGGVVGK